MGHERNDATRQIKVEVFLVLLAVAVILFLAFRGRQASDRRTLPRRPNPNRNTPPKPQPFDTSSAKTQLAGSKLEGRAYIVDGDTLVIKKVQIRLFGVDAPELNHPFGNKAKWAMVALCKGQTIRAEITEKDAYGRTVAKCYLPDGRDLSAEMVKQGMAIDWPKFSGGIYRAMELPGVRKKLWLADARQKGRMHVWEQFEAKQKVK